MARISFDPMWVAAPALVLSVFGLVADPASRAGWTITVAIGGLYLAARIAFRILKALNPPPVPDEAVQSLLALAQEEAPAWAVVEFGARVSLDEARERVGSVEYDASYRRQAFLATARLIAPSRPDVAFFYSLDKGLIAGRRDVIARLLGRYGKWTLDTWFSLLGALQREGLTVSQLDGPQLMVHGQHVG